MTITLTGANSYALKQKLSELKTEFIKQHGESGIEILSSEYLVVEKLANLFRGASLFTSHRLLILQSISSNKPVAEKITELINDIPNETSIIFVEPVIDKRTTFYKILKKETEFHEFNDLDEFAAKKWVSEHIKKEGGEISASAAQTLVQFVGPDQQRLSHEAAKLLSFNPKITEQTISELMERRPEDTIFQLLELALSDKTNQALSVLSSLERAHEDPFQAANMLIWQTHILAVVASAGDRSDAVIAKDHKLNPFVIKKTKTLARSMSKQKLRQILSTISDLDVKLKSSAIDPWRVLENTLLTI